ncbi:heavy metal translocating P-type ATPase [Skermania sp. ID1734]|uniref:heavy metal translocating P-type ATPase n=1 Tax=Skermania sp. ID1734 TaxID=2597516 RepID=UPI00117CC6B8|nr:heavy metal translocating P-type ATPase [Skermania sp. ID1734]TSD94649.1 heavy metal translocating P-type ATPase [Skermania sp. ID1734]
MAVQMHEHAHSVQQENRHAGHGAHGEVFRRKFWLSLVLAVPVVALSPMFAGLLGYHVPTSGVLSWVPPIIGTVVFCYGGMPFLSGGRRELQQRQPGMMLLIAMAITVAFVASWVTTLGIGGFDLDFWWELALLVVIMLLGHWLEMRALGAASGALDALAALLPDQAERIVPGRNDERIETVDIAELRPGEVVLVRPGGRVPADGVVVDGEAEVDESMITGESRAVRRTTGDPVVAGAVTTDSTLRIRVAAVGEQTALAGIRRLVADAEASSSRAQALADWAAAFLFYFASIAGLATFAVWTLLGHLDSAVVRTVTVLVIACPHALGLAIPLVIALSTERAAKAGVLVKDRLALERMRAIDVVLFDKTGTLTEGGHRVTGVSAAPGRSEADVISLAAAVEADSEHPLARAIVRARKASMPALRATDFRAMPGRGVRARVDGRDVYVGGPALLAELGVPNDLAGATELWVRRGATVLYVIEGASVIGALALEDAVREQSRSAVDGLHRRGVKVAMITGDARQVADSVAADLGIDEVFAEVLPQDKDAKVAQLQTRGHRVAMVGDGVNDAPALARADVGIAIGAGTDVAIESAGVVLAGDDPRAVLSVIELSRASYRKMWQNLVWATGYNVIAVPLAAGVLAFLGVDIPPAVAAVLMSVSTIVVALNAQLLRRIDLDPDRLAGLAQRSAGGLLRSGAEKVSHAET